MGIERNLIHQLTNLRQHVHRTLGGHVVVDQHTHTDNDPRYAKYSASRAQHKNTKAMRALLVENVPEPPGNVGVGPGTDWRSLRKICTARGAVSQGHARVC